MKKIISLINISFIVDSQNSINVNQNPKQIKRKQSEQSKSVNLFNLFPEEEAQKRGDQIGATIKLAAAQKNRRQQSTERVFSHFRWRSADCSPAWR
jgi:hypothetical protein